MMRTTIAIAVFTIAGCVHSQQAQPTSQPMARQSPQTQPSLEQYMRLGDVVGRKCREQIEQGHVYAGLPESQFLELCSPFQGAPVEKLNVYRLPRIGFEGVTVVAKDGRLVQASHWTDCGAPQVYFDVMTDGDRAMLAEKMAKAR